MNSPVARIFAQLQNQFAVIHNDYLNAFPLDADWPMWLVNNLGLSKVPRLITPHVDPQPQPTQNLGLLDNGIMSPMSRENSVNANPVLQDFDFDSLFQNDGPFDDKLFRDDQSASGLSSPRSISPFMSQTAASQNLQDYQRQLMLLEQGNKKQLMKARQEQDQRIPSQAQQAQLFRQQQQMASK